MSADVRERIELVESNTSNGGGSMVIQLDNALLIELGVGSLEPTQKRRVLSRYYEVLELRVGIRLSRLMGDRKLDEFESLIPGGGTPSHDDAAANEWLANNFPEYPMVVRREHAFMAEFIQQRIAAAGSEASSETQRGDQE